MCRYEVALQVEEDGFEKTSGMKMFFIFLFFRSDQRFLVYLRFDYLVNLLVKMAISDGEQCDSIAHHRGP